jgi:cytosine/adenosine deaminase-related metal-dependent hydrolase
MRVDAIHENSHVITGAGRTSALPVLHGGIVALGEDTAGLSTRRRVDLAGSTVVPGFPDVTSWFTTCLCDFQPGGSQPGDFEPGGFQLSDFELSRACEFAIDLLKW